MTSKHWTLVGGAVACLIAAGLPEPTEAAPWIEPGDAYARFKLQQAADAGKLDSTITAWPLARSNAKNVNSKDQFLWNNLSGNVGGSFELGIGGSTSPVLIQGFEGRQTEAGEVGATVEYIGDTMAVSLSPSYVPDPTDDESLRFDGSYLASTFQNWTVGAGFIDRWWGPGWQSSLILSDNARPAPSVWLNRRNTHTSNSPWLSWLGPWQFTGFVSRLEDERYVPSANLVGMRFNFRPVTSLEIGLSRLIQWGGEGQPDSLSSFWDSFIGKDNYGGNGEEQDPGNQLAGIDLRYGFSVNNSTVGLYTQVVGEDEAGYLPSRKVYQFGMDWTSSLAGGEQQWFIEGVDTLTEGLFGGETRPNYAYEHFNYKSGMRYLGRNIATTFDADARAITLGGYHFSTPEVRWHAALTWAELNRDGGVRFEKGAGTEVDYFVPAYDQELVMIQLSHTRPMPIGEATLQLSVASDDIDLADDTVSDVVGAIEWRIPLK